MLITTYVIVLKYWLSHTHMTYTRAYMHESVDVQNANWFAHGEVKPKHVRCMEN